MFYDNQNSQKINEKWDFYQNNFSGSKHSYKLSYSI